MRSGGGGPLGILSTRSLLLSMCRHRRVRNDWRAFQGGGVPAAGDPFEGLEFRGRPVDDAMLMLFEDVFEGRRLNFEQNSRAFGVKPVVGLIQRRMAVKGDFDPGSFRKFLLAYLKYG